MTNFKYSIVAAIPLILVLGLGCNNSSTTSHPSDQNSFQEKTQSELVLVETVSATMKNFSKEMRVVGTVEPLQQVDILPLESGQILHILVDVGDAVKKGDLLVELVNPIISRDVVALHVEAEAASKQLLRIRQAFDAAPGLIPASDLDEAEAKSARASAALAAGEDRLRFLEVRAPINGIVSARNAHPGAVVENGITSPGQTPILIIVQCSNIRVHLPYPERDLRFIYEGSDIELNFPDLDRKISTKVSRVSAAIDATSRTVDVMVDLKQSDCSLRPGIYVEGALMGGSRDSLMSLPSSVRFIENGLPFASAVIDGIVTKIPLTILAEDKLSIAFSADGINLSTQFIITGRNLVRVGEAVKTRVKQ